MRRVHPSVMSEVRMFAYYLGNRTLALDLLDEVDYDCIFNQASALEQVFAIFMNNLELDEAGAVIHPVSTASHRAAQWIRRYVDRSYVVEPPFEDWETELH